MFAPQFSIRKLLAHRTGIRHYTNGVGGSIVPPTHETNNPQINTGMQWALPLWIDQPLGKKPETYSYTSFGYNLAGVVIKEAANAKVEEQSFWQRVKSQLNDNLGLTTLQPDYNWINLSNRALGFYKNSQGKLASGT